MDTIINLDIGGTRFKTFKSTLKKTPDSKLGRLSTTDSNYIIERDEYFFDRSPELFNVILDYYRCPESQVHIPSYICGSVLLRELEFWEIPFYNISDCCFHAYTNFKNDQDVRDNVVTKNLHNGKLDNDISFRHRTWLFFDQPTSSRCAMKYFTIYMILVLLSVLTSCLVTEPSLRDDVPMPGVPHLDNATIEATDNKNQQQQSIMSNSKPQFIVKDDLSWKTLQFIKTRPKPALRVIDFFTNFFFLIELILHFIFCPNKKLFLRDNNNKIDVFVFIFTVVYFIVNSLASEFMVYKSYRIIFIISNVTVMFKLLRCFRLTKVYIELRILLLALKASSKELILLLVTFGMFSIVFGNLIYYTEIMDPDTFPDIFIGIWWAVVTMTTVGYGDFVPKTPAGYITGIITSMSGLLIIAMPIAIIARNFDVYYNIHSDRKLKQQQCVSLKSN